MQLGDPYWDMSSWSFWEREWADSKDTLNRERVFAKQTADEQVLITFFGGSSLL